MLVLPADHVIDDQKALQRALALATVAGSRAVKLLTSCSTRLSISLAEVLLAVGQGMKQETALAGASQKASSREVMVAADQSQNALVPGKLIPPVAPPVFTPHCTPRVSTISPATKAQRH